MAGLFGGHFPEYNQFFHIVNSHCKLMMWTIFLCSEMCTVAENTPQAEITTHPILDIRKVFNTSRRQWVFKQTMSNVEIYQDTSTTISFQQQCMFIKKIEISNATLEFWLKMIVNGEKVQIRMRGQFVQNGINSPISMTVTDLSANETSPFETMTLGYTWSGCSVFYITALEEGVKDQRDETRRRECQMYIRNDVSKSPDDQCKRFYKQNCKNQHYIIYKKSCESTK
uniref:Lipocalin/cytosolic fatty-acid binding domain-containing protein n=1 Tax=Amblyomma maculatum TaxID=34609 RepID=G3MQ59_AMBMU